MNYINVSLGKTDEEKFMNIQSIKKVKRWFKKLVKLEMILAGFILVIGIQNGAMSIEGMGIFGTILLFIFLIIASYYLTYNIYGEIFAWGLFVIGQKKFMEHIPDPVSTEEIVRAYCIGGQDYAAWVSMSDFSFTYIIVCICIGIWLGAINAILHHKEVKEVEKRIKEKYQNEKPKATNYGI